MKRTKSLGYRTKCFVKRQKEKNELKTNQTKNMYSTVVKYTALKYNVKALILAEKAKLNL